MSNIVYLVSSPSGKKYVGITSKSLKRRKSQHLSNACKGSPYTFHKAIRKYGVALEWSILEEVACYEEAKRLEIHYITLFNSFKKGYNSTLGGDGVLGKTFSHTEEAKRKISENWNRHGFKHSEESKKKIGDVQRGKSKAPMKQKTKDKLSELRKGEKNGMFGKTPWNYKGGKPKCLDCEKQLSTYTAKRCVPCTGKHRRKGICLEY